MSLDLTLLSNLASGAIDVAHPEAAAGSADGGASTFVPFAFWTFALLAVVPSFLVIAVRDVVRAAFLLLGSLAGVAGLYAVLGADFVSFAQVLVYIGGILILLLFGVMLTNREPIFLGPRARSPWTLVVPGVLTGVVFLGALLYVTFAVDWRVVEAFEPKPTTRGLGELLLTDFLLPFEIVSVLLLVAMIGAAVIARRKGDTTEPD